MTRTLRALCAAALCTLASFGANATESKVLNIYNWNDYIAEDTIRNFEKETGIKVRYDTYDLDEVLQARLLIGNSGYDIVVPGTDFAKSQIDSGGFQKLDRSKLSNWGNMDSAILDQMARVDPGNQHLVNWLWGFTTVGINTHRLKAALGDLKMPDNPWQLVFDPKYAAKAKACGISVIDAPSVVLPLALGFIGKHPYSKAPGDYADAGAMLRAVRPYITHFSASGYIDRLAGGDLCVVIGYSGDINIARTRALQAKKGEVIEALVPKGATLFFDSMAIPRDAQNVESAHLFINYILRPEVHASLTNKVFYANPNTASMKFVNKDVAANRTVFPEAEALRSMVVPEALPQNVRKVQARTYAVFKSGL
jgi:putrescine transport system substrate-binding protein